MKAALLLLALLLSACAPARCPPLPEMAPGQTLQEYTIDVVMRYNACRGE